MCNNPDWSLNLTKRERILFRNPCLLLESFNLPLPPPSLHPCHKILKLFSPLRSAEQDRQQGPEEKTSKHGCVGIVEKKGRNKHGKGQEHFLPILSRDFLS